MKRLIIAIFCLLFTSATVHAQGQMAGAAAVERAVNEFVNKFVVSERSYLLVDGLPLAIPAPTPTSALAPTPEPAPKAPAFDQKWSGFVEAAGTLKPGAQFGGMNLSVAKGRWWGWAQLEPGFEQAYGGPRFNLGPVEVGVAAGIKNTPGHWQTGAYDFYAKGRFSQLNLWERGAKGGWWFRNESNVAVTKRFSVGAFGQRNAGWGVRAGLKFRHSELWGAVLEQRSHEKPNRPTFLLGLRRYF